MQLFILKLYGKHIQNQTINDSLFVSKEAAFLRAAYVPAVRLSRIPGSCNDLCFVPEPSTDLIVGATVLDGNEVRHLTAEVRVLLSGALVVEDHLWLDCTKNHKKKLGKKNGTNT